MSAPSSDEAGIRQVIRALKAADHTITGGHNGAAEFKASNATSEDVIIDELMACDSSSLYVTLPDGSTSFVFFVLGNDPEEVVCDHGTNLEPVLNPLTASWW